jgi:hypothetical protein
MLGPHEHVVGVDIEHDRDMGLAQDILAVLVNAYPGYHWFVVIRAGIIQIKISNWSGSWGMSLHYNAIAHDASERAREVKRSAGEFLERANMIRGRGKGELVKHIEGVPDKAIIRI